MKHAIPYRQLGRTELYISELSLGTVELGVNYGIAPATAPAAGLPPPSLTEATRLLHRTLDAGINFIDTARAYGRSEEIIGRALLNRRQEVYLATKVHCLDGEGNPLSGQTLRHQLEESLHTSLRSLRTDWVDLLLIHNATLPLLQAGEVLPHLKTLQEKGVTRYIGLSTYGVEAPLLALEGGGFDALQVAYNVLDQRMAGSVFPLAQAKGVGIVVRSVYLKGALTERAEDLPPHLEPLKQRSQAFRRYVAGLTPPLTPVQAALRFVLSRPDIATVLVGVRSEAELAEAISAAQAGSLPAEVLAHLESLRWDDPVMLDPSTWGIP